MAKTRLKEIVDDLSDVESVNEKSLADFNGSAISYKENDSSEKEISNKMFTVLKQVFLFAPGAVFLWFTSWGIMEGLLTSSPIPFWAYLLFISSFFMVILGLGNVRKPRDYFIPFASILLGAGFGVLSGLFTDLLRIFVNFITPAGLFSFAPLIWIVPFLVKLRLERIEKDTNSEQHT
jgi:hypothetical protein